MADPTAFLLPPMRPQKRMLVIDSDQQAIPVESRSRDSEGNLTIAALKRTITQSDFEQSWVTLATETAAKLTNYLYIRLKGRGVDTGTPLEFQFLINPDMISVNHQTVDAESLTRGGPQVGLWGETTDISISGSTAGQYFADTLVDGFGEYSLSYRNFMMLQAVYENNGYWFEGEAAGSRVLAASHTLRQIQLQADVELGFGNFIWSGCFTDFSVDDTADTPYYNKFSLGFMVWKERYRASSPWRNSISNDSVGGHAYECKQALLAARAAATQKLIAQLDAIRLGTPIAPEAPVVQMNALPTEEKPSSTEEKPSSTAAIPFGDQLPVLQQLHDNSFRNPKEQAFMPPVMPS